MRSFFDNKDNDGKSKKIGKVEDIFERFRNLKKQGRRDSLSNVWIVVLCIFLIGLSPFFIGSSYTGYVVSDLGIELGYGTDSKDLKEVVEFKDTGWEVGSVEFIDKDSVSSVKSGEMIYPGQAYDMKISFHKSPIKEIVVNDMVLDEGIGSILIDDVPEENVLEMEFEEVYAIDPSRVNFSYAVVRAVAKGNYLYKCASWDYDLEKCEISRECLGEQDEKGSNICNVSGGWKKVRRIEPGKEYSFILTMDDPGFAEYSLNYTAPYCDTGESPCVANSTLLSSKDNIIGGGELNQPNTIDGCADGTAGTYANTETIENITVIDYNRSYFLTGDSVGVSAWAYCDSVTPGADHFGLVYTNDSSAVSPQWRLKQFITSCPGSGLNKIVFNNVTLDNVSGDHAFRVYVQYNSFVPDSTETCSDSSGGGASTYDDNDDLVFKVVSPVAPVVGYSSSSPLDGESVHSDSVIINATVDENVSSCTLVWDPPLSSDSGADEWKMFMKNLYHGGYSNTNVPDDINGSNVTTFNTASGGIHSSPVVSGGYVYIGSGLVMMGGQTFFQLNSSNISQKIAEFDTGSEIATAPAVAGDFVYLSGADHKFYQFNASNISQKIAEYTTGNAVYSSPAVSDGYVYVGSDDGKLYQFNASNISLKIAELDTGNFMPSSPAVSGNYVYMGAYDNKLYQLDKDNISNVINTFTAGNIIRSSPTVKDGYVYVGCHDNNVYQLDASNVSKLVANFSTGNSVLSSPAVGNGFVYVGSYDNKVYQLNASNVSQKIAEFLTGDDVVSSAAITSDYVFIGSYDNNFYQLNASNISQEISRYVTGGDIESSPAISQGYVYFGSDDAKVYQIGNHQPSAPSKAVFYYGMTVHNNSNNTWASYNVTGLVENVTYEYYVECTDDTGLKGRTANRTLDYVVCIDNDSDGYYANCVPLDCNDNSSSMYPGASCTRSGYSGSTYDSSCVCTGGTALGGGGGGGGGGSSSYEQEDSVGDDVIEVVEDDIESDEDVENLPTDILEIVEQEGLESDEIIVEAKEGEFLEGEQIPVLKPAGENNQYTPGQIKMIQKVTSYDHDSEDKTEQLSSESVSFKFLNKGNKALQDVEVSLDKPNVTVIPPRILHPRKVWGWDVIGMTGWALQAYIRSPDLLQWEVTEPKNFYRVDPGEEIDLGLDYRAPLSKLDQYVLLKINVKSLDQVIYSETVSVEVNTTKFRVVADPHDSENIVDIYLIVSNQYDVDKVYNVELNINTQKDPEYSPSRSFKGMVDSIFGGPKTLITEYYGPFKIDAKDTQIFAYRYSYSEEFEGDYFIKYSLYDGIKKEVEAKGEFSLEYNEE